MIIFTGSEIFNWVHHVRHSFWAIFLARSDDSLIIKSALYSKRPYYLVSLPQEYKILFPESAEVPFQLKSPFQPKTAIWAILEHLNLEISAAPTFQRDLFHMLTAQSSDSTVRD